MAFDIRGTPQPEISQLFSIFNLRLFIFLRDLPSITSMFSLNPCTLPTFVSQSCCSRKRFHDRFHKNQFSAFSRFISGASTSDKNFPKAYLKSFGHGIHDCPSDVPPVAEQRILGLGSGGVSNLLLHANPFSFSRKKKQSGNIRAASDAPREVSRDGEPESKPKTLQLAVIFGLWYFQNIVFNIYNKKTLNVFPFPWLLASFQLLAGSIWMFFLWSFKIQPCPKVSKEFILALLGPAFFHTVGHISACVSFSKVAVSFTHVIKSAEPVFSVVFSTFLGSSYPLTVWLSILPIVIGCSLAAVTEVSFNLGGLSGALISNVGFVLRNIYSKKSLQSFKEVNGLNLYGWISIVSLLYLFPVAVFVEGSQWVEGYKQAIQTVGKPSTFYLWVILSGIFYHLYNQSSYQALDDISPLTFSVSNTMKRVVVIVATVIVFRNPVQPLNALGSGIAILGTFLYSQATAAAKNGKKDGGVKKS